MAYQPKVYRKQGAAELVVASGGTLTLEAGAVLNAGTAQTMASGKRIAYGTQQAKIFDPSGGTTEDTQARAAIAAIIDALEAFGITATS